MSLTLAQAKTMARVVESGMLPTDPRVVDRINEAVARLHAMGDFVGSIERYGVTVDQATGEFETPTGLQNVMRVAELPTGLAHSTVGTLFSRDEYAFVFDTSSPLPMQQAAPNRFKVRGKLPLAVDVMGKRKLVAAVDDSDELAVTDVYAIKLMLLALWREENNLMDLAQGLIGQAVAQLVSKTDTAVAEARRVNFTTMASRLGENTFGFARAHVALAVTEGLRLDDHKFQEVINEAERRIMVQTRMWEPRIFKVYSGLLALPYSYESVLAITIDNVPQTVRANWHEYSSDGTGYREGAYYGPSTIHRGEHPLYRDLTAASQLTITTLANERLVSVTLRGRSLTGAEISETAELNGASSYTTTQIFADVTSIIKDVSEGAVSISDGVSEVAYLEGWQTESRCERYAIASSGECAERIIRAVLRPRWHRKLRDSDVMQVKCLPAITNMAIAVMAERAGDLDRSTAYEERAMRFVESERLSKESGHQRRVVIQNKGFAAGRVQNLS